MDVLVMAQIPKILRGEEINFSPIISYYVNKTIIESLLTNLTVPEDFRGVVDILIFAEQMKAFSALLRGEEYTPSLDQVINLIVSLQMVSALEGAFGGGESGGGTAG